MKLICIYTIIICSSISQLKGRDPDWFNRRSNDLEDAIKIENTNARIDALGKFMSLASYGEMDEEQKIIFNRAQTNLLSIPGHAKYYQEKIDKMRAELLANTKKTHEELKNMQDEGNDVLDEPTYLGDSQIALRTLRYMPSAETVTVLGYFLNDSVGRDGKTFLGTPLKMPGDTGPHLCNAELATDVIRVLGIEHPPFNDSKGVITPAEIDAWKDWWNEVKDGKRTYRFIGSEVEYGPDGPAATEAIQHVERDRKRDEERETGQRKTTISPEAASAAAMTTKSLPIAGILAAFALIGAAVWYYLRRRRMG